MVVAEYHDPAFSGAWLRRGMSHTDSLQLNLLTFLRGAGLHIRRASPSAGGKPSTGRRVTHGKERERHTHTERERERERQQGQRDSEEREVERER